MRHRLAIALLAVWLAHPALAESPQAKLGSTIADLKASKAQEAALRKQLAGSAREVEALRDDATRLAADMQRAERRVTAEEQRARALGSALSTKERAFEARRREYASTVASLLRMQRIPATTLLADGSHAKEAVRTARVMQQVNAALADRAAALRREVQTLQQLRQKTAQSKLRLAKETATLNEQRKRLDRDLAKRQALQKQLSRDLAAAQVRVNELSRESSNLQELITKLESNRAAVAQREARPATAIGSTAKGRWKQPVAGKIAHRFGERKNENEKYRGVVLSARAGATVVSPAAGEVVFTGPFRDYGRMVLVKHAGGRISLLAGLGTIAVTLNQPVGAGEPVGGMGGHGTPELYYELREGSKPIDPARWFAKLGA